MNKPAVIIDHDTGERYYPITDILKEIKSKIKDLDLEFTDEEYKAGIAYGIMKVNEIIDTYIERGENKNDS